MVKIATSVYKTEEIELQDGRTVVLKPLPIAKLRRFMDEWKKIEDLSNDDPGYDIFVNCSGICLEKDFKGEFDSLKGVDGETLSAEYKEHLEETLDMDSIYKIIEVCAGIKLNDPKLMEALVAAAQTELEQDGTN